jgi:hypothetical protein
MPEGHRGCYPFSAVQRSRSPLVSLCALSSVAFVTVTTALSLPAGCKRGAPNPYTTTGSSSSSGTGGHGGAGGGGVDPELGGPCVDDTECNDNIACTFDKCDTSVGRCRFKPDDSLCQDGVYCNGVERCDQKLGCVAGAPIGCEDDNICTIDTCIESTQSCTHVLRDADGDGDPDIHCGGGDCDDQNPNVSSKLPEICGNGIDDNCNGQMDETPCISPAHDKCVNALDIPAPGTYQMNTAGAQPDYATSCSPMGMLRDVVAAIELPAGPPVDVIVVAKSSSPVSIAVAGQCGMPGTELACGGSFTSFTGNVARLRARALGDPAKATAYPLYVTTSGPGGPVSLDVSFVPAAPAPTNETCGTAIPITPGTPVIADLTSAAHDLKSSCPTLAGDLVYSFTLPSPSDVDIFGASTDGLASPTLSLRDTGCALPADEITCGNGPNAHIYRRSLAAGTYYIDVAASVNEPISVDLELSPPSAPPPDETCSSPPSLTAGITQNVALDHHQDDVPLPCLAGGVDAAYQLDLTEASDVLLVERISAGDSAAVALSLPACAMPSDFLVCGTGVPSPIVRGKRNVAPGSYRVVAKSASGEPEQITAFTRKTSPATLVLFANACADAFVIPADGGFFQGNTANATGSFTAGCDSSNGAPAPVQMLRLDLASKKRVVFDMQGSGYSTLLDIRKGPSCPGDEVTLGCSAALGSSGAPKSFLDLTLDPGSYYVQVGGLGGDAGPWFLNVFVADPGP